MKVSELIETLKNIDPDTNIVVEYDNMFNDICEVFSGETVSNNKFVCIFHHYYGSGMYNMKNRFPNNIQRLWETEDNKKHRIRHEKE